MDIKLVALDIDGTIIPPNTPPERAYPSPRLTRVVRDLRAAGTVIVLASGRMFPGTAQIARHFGLDTPVICQQGCSVHTLDGAMLHEFPIEQRVAREIAGYARETSRILEWFNPVRYIASAETAETIEYARVSGITPEYRAAPEDSGLRPTGVGVISSLAASGEVHRHLVAAHGDGLHVLDFPGVTVAVDADANKGHALSLLCADLGIDRSRVLAVGDSVNDAPMLAWAGRGVALAHSDQYARDAADEILDEIGDDDPLATLLQRLVR